MDEYHVDANATAAMSGIPALEVEAILDDKLRVGVNNANRLEVTFGPSANFWLALDERYRAGLAEGRGEVP